MNLTKSSRLSRTISQILFVFLVGMLCTSSVEAYHLITNGMSLSEINNVLSGASYGDTVYVEAGTYNISGKLNMKPGITLTKYNSSNPVFNAINSGSQLLEMYYTSDIEGCTFSSITFWNVRFKILYANQVTFQYCIFDYGKRKPGTTKTYLNDAYIQITSTSDVEIRNCVFSRRSGNSGRGIYTKQAYYTDIKNNSFGNGGSTGYFVTAINDNSNYTTISGNTIQRKASWVNTSETDHGIYAHSFQSLDISNNYISGWPANSSGGAIKARNGIYLDITDNTLVNSGVILNVYDSGSYPYLAYVLVKNNTINVSSDPNDIYHGIGYWRNTSSGYEYSIRIEDNDVRDGTIKVQFTALNVNYFNAYGGGVFYNNISSLYLKSGINNYGNY